MYQFRFCRNKMAAKRSKKKHPTTAAAAGAGENTIEWKNKSYLFGFIVFVQLPIHFSWQMNFWSVCEMCKYKTRANMGICRAMDIIAACFINGCIPFCGIFLITSTSMEYLILHYCIQHLPALRRPPNPISIHYLLKTRFSPRFSRIQTPSMQFKLKSSVIRWEFAVGTKWKLLHLMNIHHCPFDWPICWVLNDFSLINWVAKLNCMQKSHDDEEKNII